MAGLRVPLSTLQQRPYDRYRMTRGRGGWLGLPRTTLAFVTPCRSPGALSVRPAAWVDGWMAASGDEGLVTGSEGPHQEIRQESAVEALHHLACESQPAAHEPGDA